MNKSYLLRYNAMQSREIRPKFRSNISPSIFRVRDYAKQEHEEACSKLLAFYWMLGVLFDHKNGDITFHRNVGKLLSDFGASYPRIYCSSNELGQRSEFETREGQIFSSPHPYRFWGPPSVISSGCRGIFFRGQRGRGVKLTTQLQLGKRKM